MRGKGEFASVERAIASGKPDSHVEYERAFDNPIGRQRLCKLIGTSMWYDDGTRFGQRTGLLNDRIPRAHGAEHPTTEPSYDSQAERNARQPLLERRQRIRRRGR
jgi:hypothetical protein